MRGTPRGTRRHVQPAGRARHGPARGHSAGPGPGAHVRARPDQLGPGGGRVRWGGAGVPARRGCRGQAQRPHRLRPRTSLAKEAALLAAPEPTLPGRVPTLLGYAQVDTGASQVELLVISRARRERRGHRSDRARRVGPGGVLREGAAVLRSSTRGTRTGCSPQVCSPSTATPPGCAAASSWAWRISSSTLTPTRTAGR